MDFVEMVQYIRGEMDNTVLIDSSEMETWITFMYVLMIVESVGICESIEEAFRVTVGVMEMVVLAQMGDVVRQELEQMGAVVIIQGMDDDEAMDAWGGGVVH